MQIDLGEKSEGSPNAQKGSRFWREWNGCLSEEAKISKNNKIIAHGTSDQIITAWQCRATLTIPPAAPPGGKTKGWSQAEIQQNMVWHCFRHSNWGREERGGPPSTRSGRKHKQSRKFCSNKKVSCFRNSANPSKFCHGKNVFLFKFVKSFKQKIEGKYKYLANGGRNLTPSSRKYLFGRKMIICFCG